MSPFADFSDQKTKAVDCSTYHVTSLSAGTSEDEDRLGAVGTLALLELITGVRTQLANLECVCFRRCKSNGRGRSQAGEHGKG